MFVYQHPVVGRIELPEPTAEELKCARYTANDQFMGDCWCRGLSYADYAMHATRLQYTVYDEAEYTRYCKDQDAQMAAYYDQQ